MRNSCTYKIGGTKTFRRSSTKRFGKWGNNTQNIEKSMREVYIPDGFSDDLFDKCLVYLATKDLSVFTEEELFRLRIFVQVDQSGADALIVAYIARAGKFRSLFENGVKPHVYVAMRLFKGIWKKKMQEQRLLTSDDTFDIDEFLDMPICDLKKHVHWRNLENVIKDSDNWALTERYYYLAKQTCHSGNYGITAPTFRMNILEKSGGKIVVSQEDAEYFLQSYKELFPEIFEWHDSLKHQVETTKMLYNLHGHPYQITQPYIVESMWKELFAWVPQSTVAEITSKAKVSLHLYTVEHKKKWDNLAETHDSLLSQCPLGEEQEMSLRKMEFMGQEFISPVDGTKFRMKSEAQIGFNWNSFKKDKNPLGLR